LKRKRPDFMQGEPPSWTQGWHHQNSANGRGKVNKYMRTHESEGDRIVPGWAWAGRPKPAGLAHSGGQFGVLFIASTLSSWRRHHSQHREPFAQETIHKLERRGGRSFVRRIAQLEGSTHKWRRRNTPSEASPWSTVPCLAPWWGNLLICSWVVIELEDVIATLFGYLSII
jgi:hypothetical protein